MNRLLTLFLALSLIFTVVVDVDAHIDTPRARNFSPHRMIKKRGVVGGLFGANAPPENVATSPGGPAASSVGPAANTQTDTAAASSPVVTATPTGVATSVGTEPTASASSTGNPNIGGILSGIVGPILGSTASAKPNATSVVLANSTVA